MRKKLVFIIKKINKDYWKKQSNIITIIKNDCKSRQEINIENYLTKKKHKKIIWKK